MANDLIFKVEDGVAKIILNRPESLNAFSYSMMEKWAESLERIRDDKDIRVGILTGNGKAFCVGGDIKAIIKEEGFFLADTENKKYGYSHDSAMDRKNSLAKVIQRIPLIMEQIDKPMIAAINGDAIGAGLDMSLMCDMRFAADTAKVAEGYINLGVVPGDGGAYFLPRIVGIEKALEMLWLGDVLDANEAKEIGLVSRVFPESQLIYEVEKIAKRLSESPQMAIQMIKRSLYQSLDMNLSASLDLISSHMAILTETDEFKEKIDNFSKRMS